MSSHLRSIVEILQRGISDAENKINNLENIYLKIFEKSTNPSFKKIGDKIRELILKETEIKTKYKFSRDENQRQSPLFDELDKLNYDIEIVYNESIDIFFEILIDEIAKLEKFLSENSNYFKEEEFFKLNNEIEKMKNYYLKKISNEDIADFFDKINYSFNLINKEIEDRKDKAFDEIEKIRNNSFIIYSEIEKLYKFSIKNMNSDILTNIYLEAKKLIKNEINMSLSENLLQVETDKNRSLKALLEKAEELKNTSSEIKKTSDFKIIHGSDIFKKIDKQQVIIDSDKKQTEIKKINNLYMKLKLLNNKNIINKVQDQINNLENKDIQQLETIKMQLKFWLSENEKMSKKSLELKKILIKNKIFLKYIDSISDKFEIGKTIDELIEKPIITDEEFNNVLQKIENLKKEEILKHQLENIKNLNQVFNIIKQSFYNMGYITISENLNINESIYFDTGWENYKIKLRLNENSEITIKFVKIVEKDEDKNTISNEEKEKDLYLSKLWCQSLRNIIDNIQKNGIMFKNLKIYEPEEIGIEIEVNKELYKSKGISDSIKNRKHHIDFD